MFLRLYFPVVLAASILHFLLQLGSFYGAPVQAPEEDGALGTLAAYSWGPISALVHTFPSFLAGFVARRRGFILGGFAAFIGAGAWSIYWSQPGVILESPTFILPLALQASFYGLGPAVIGFFAGGAGEYTRSRRAI